MGIRTRTLRATVPLALLAFTASLAAQELPLELTRLAGTITIDGRPDEPAWSAVPTLPLTMYQPVFNGTPTQRSEIRIAYDDANLYAAGHFHDTDPDAIRVNSLYRDRWNGDDAFAIYIDAFNDNRNAKWFGVTAAGMRFDQLVSDDGATLNGNWDAFWDARATITSEGWFVEVRIPFSTLGFRTEDDRVVMGLTVTRLISRNNERVTFPAIEPRFEFRRPSVARDVVLTDVHSAKPLYVTPYVLAGVDRTALRPAGVPDFDIGQETAREIGADLRYPLSSELTLDVTMNTDFAQVEADDQQVALDRFSLFFPEKRRFFQERAELFDFTMGQAGGRLFHSRRIGLAPGLRVPVIGGARLVGRAGAWDIGILDMQTDDAGGVPGENFGVARVKHGILNPYSHLGALVTTRFRAGAHNVAYGVDGTVRVFGDDEITARWAQTYDDADSAGTGAFDRAQLFLQWRRRATRGLMFDINTTRSGASFAPALGFQPRRDFLDARLLSEYYFFTDSHPWLRRVWPGMLAFHTYRNRDDALESGTWAVWLQWETKNGGGGWIEPKVFLEDVAAPFRVGDALIPAGRYTFADLQLFLRMGSGARLRTSLDARAGSWFDGTRAQLIIQPTWNVAPQLELGGDYQFTRLRFDDRAGTDIHLGRLRIRAALDARASASAIVQYNSTTDRLGINFRARYNFAEGTDLWIVYDELLDTLRPIDEFGIRPPLSERRTFIVKYTHTFQW